MSQELLTQIDEHGVATLRLNRPQVHNAFDDQLIATLITRIKELEASKQVRMLVLASEGKSFSAGADLGWMKRMAEYSKQENVADALELAELMKCLDRFTRPTMALVQGAAYGGALGLLACCDMVIASHRASFCLSEVRLGLIPAVISPYVVAAIGPRAARRYFQSAERFDATEAHRLGLVHELVPPEDLEERGRQFCSTLLQNGPRAMKAAKALIPLVTKGAIDDEMIQETAGRIAEARASDEGREGLGAFFDKRSPNWMKG